MRSEVGVTPWSRYVKVMLDGQELKHCRMADEELGCAEVYHLHEDGKSRLDPRIHGTKMVFGKVELAPAHPIVERIFADPEHAQAIWDEYYETKFGEMDRQIQEALDRKRPFPTKVKK